MTRCGPGFKTDYLGEPTDRKDPCPMGRTMDPEGKHGGPDGVLWSDNREQEGRSVMPGDTRQVVQL